MLKFLSNGATKKGEKAPVQLYYEKTGYPFSLHLGPLAKHELAPLHGEVTKGRSSEATDPLRSTGA